MLAIKSWYIIEIIAKQNVLNDAATNKHYIIITLQLIGNVKFLQTLTFSLRALHRTTRAADGATVAALRGLSRKVKDEGGWPAQQWWRDAGRRTSFLTTRDVYTGPVTHSLANLAI